MKIRFVILILLSCLSGLQIIAQTPPPPAGKIWVLNPEMSDEFDANSPGEIWDVFDKADSWDRTAAWDKRVPEVQLVEEDGTENYILAMNPMWYDEEDIFTKNGRTYYFAGGGMDTKARTSYGYMEVRIKPSDFPMGSGVFMFSRTSSDDPCGEKYTTELDIIENMSYTGPGASDWWNGKHHVNTHVWPTDLDCNRLTSIQHGGASRPLEGPLDFNVVGAWWKNKDSVDFFLNGTYWHTVEFQRDFDLPMPLILTMETYTWGSDENNADNPKPEEYMFQDDFRIREQRAVYYDWVRTWKLVDIDTAIFNIENDHIEFHDPPSLIYPDSVLDFTVIRSARDSREIILTVFDDSLNSMGSDTLEVGPGVQSELLHVDLDSILKIGSNYSVVSSLVLPGGNGSDVLSSDTAYLTVEAVPVETLIFEDGFPKQVFPSSEGYFVDVFYQGASDMEIAVEVRDPAGSWIGGGLADVPDGNGMARIWAGLISATEPGGGYYWKTHIRPRGTTWRESVHALGFLPFQVVMEPQNAISIEVQGWPVWDTIEVVTVSATYNALEQANLELSLHKEAGPLIADTLIALAQGSGTLEVDLKIEKVPLAGTDYTIAGLLMNEDREILLAGDSITDLEVKELEDPVGLENQEAEGGNGFRIYPNPASDQISIMLHPLSGVIESIHISDLSGRVLINLDPSQFQNPQEIRNIDISSLNPGYHIINILSDQTCYRTGIFVH